MPPNTITNGSVPQWDDTAEDPGHNIDLASDERATRLRHLLRLNHDTYSILYNNGRFHNHTPHFLGSSYLAGASIEQLQWIYDDAVRRDNLEAWTPSPGQISTDNYREHIAAREYQRAWMAFFDEQLTASDNKDAWQAALVKFLLQVDQNGNARSAPLLCSLVADLGHPLIHLGYAFELGSRDVAIEAMSLVATCYDTQLVSLLTSPSPPPSNTTSDLFELFDRVHNDSSLPRYPQPGDENLPLLLADQNHIDTIMHYLDSFSLPAALPQTQLLNMYYLSSQVFVSTAPNLAGHGYDFFLVHLLTTTHAIRLIIRHLPSTHHNILYRQWLLMALLAYTSQNRPHLTQSAITNYNLQGRNWEFVRQKATSGPHASDAHFVKACRAFLVASETYRDYEEHFLKCAVKFASEFDGWGGFNTSGEDAAEARKHRIKDGIHVR